MFRYIPTFTLFIITAFLPVMSTCLVCILVVVICLLNPICVVITCHHHPLQVPSTSYLIILLLPAQVLCDDQCSVDAWKTPAVVTIGEGNLQMDYGGVVVVWCVLVASVWGNSCWSIAELPFMRAHFPVPATTYSGDDHCRRSQPQFIPC